MKRWLPLIGGLCLALVLARGASAAGSQPQLYSATWQAAYWNNITLTGTPILRRTETSLDHNWDAGSPAATIRPDHFSARWTGDLTLVAGTYRFAVTADDGVRLWVDNTLIIDAWNDHPVTTYTADRVMSGRPALVVIDYYEHTGHAVAQFTWALTTPVSGYWRGEYFNNVDLSGEPALVRYDPEINFDWGLGSPAPGLVNADNFGAHWTRDASLPAGRYYFAMTSDDGAWLWVNGELLIDSWKDQPPTTHDAEVTLPGGSVELMVEYYEHTYGGVAKLSFGLTDDTSGLNGIVVDTHAAGFVKGGSATSWHSAAGGYGTSYLWTWNNDWARAGYNWARWYPNLSARRYEVFAYIPNRYTTTRHARYWISHAGGYTLRVVSQAAYDGHWVSLGTYTFRGTRSDYASLSDVTYEKYLSQLIAFDAMKWVPR